MSAIRAPIPYVPNLRRIPTQGDSPQMANIADCPNVRLSGATPVSHRLSAIRDLGWSASAACREKQEAKDLGSSRISWRIRENRTLAWPRPIPSVRCHLRVRTASLNCGRDTSRRRRITEGPAVGSRCFGTSVGGGSVFCAFCAFSRLRWLPQNGTKGTKGPQPRDRKRGMQAPPLFCGFCGSWQSL